ncbi:MAG: hypothetical protein K9G64_03280 [Bacteroidia bacterium]|nr:hypothetical protein [Bacteroidia bacterium]
MKVFVSIHLFFAIILQIFIQNTFAQNKYISINSGYNFGVSTTSVYFKTSSNGIDYSTKKLDLSLGKGINLDCNFGYLFNKYLAAELGISYLFGTNSSFEGLLNNVSSVNRFSKTYASSVIKLVPTLVISAGLDKINPYAKLGFIIGTASYTEKSEDIFEYNNGSSQVLLKTIKYDGGIAFGISNSIGVSYLLKENINLLLEINSVNLSYAASKSEVQNIELDGKSLMGDRTVFDNQVEYSDDFIYSSSNPIDPNKPRKALKENVSFNSLGFSIGAKYQF